MYRTCLRCATLGVLLVTFAAALHAQSLEVFAGGRHLSGMQALQTPLSPGSIAIAPDGSVHVMNRARAMVYRFDPASGTVTAQPITTSDRMVFSPLDDIAIGPDGTAYAHIDDRIVKLDFTARTQQHLSGGGGGGSYAYCNGSLSSPAGYLEPGKIAVGPNGSVFVPDRAGHHVCRIDPAGNSSYVAGGSYRGFAGDGLPANQSLLDEPSAVALDASGNLYIADTVNHRVRKVSAASGIITTIAGTGFAAPNGDGIPATVANLGFPSVLAADAAGNVFVYERSNRRVRRIDAATGLIETFAGSGAAGFSGDGGPATQAALSQIAGIAIAANGDVYLSDQDNGRVRRVAAATGIIDTVIGNGEVAFCAETAPRRDACLGGVSGVVANAAGDIFISDFLNRRIRRISAATGVLTTIAGGGAPGATNGDGGPALDATFEWGPEGLALDAGGNLYIAAGADNRIRRIDAATGIITTIAGTGEGSSAGDDGLATLATVQHPTHLAFDAEGNLYFSEHSSGKVRRIAASGVITKVAGGAPNTRPLGDGGPAVDARLVRPRSLVLDPAGNLLILDSGAARLRRVDRNTGIITTVAGNGGFQISGDGGLATTAELGLSTALAMDPVGNLFLTSSSGYSTSPSALRRIDAATGIITGATGEAPFVTPEGFQLQSPSQMSFHGNQLYIGDGVLDVVFRARDFAIPPPDDTPPVIRANVTGGRGLDNYYRGFVTISWTISDPGSVIFAREGCQSITLTQDQAPLLYRCKATSAGGSAEVEIAVGRDNTPPTISFGATVPAANAAGWHTSPFVLPYTAQDALSGVDMVSPPSPMRIGDSYEEFGGWFNVHVADRAGNIATFRTPSFNIDMTAPEIEPVVSGTVGNDGWYTSDVIGAFAVYEIEESLLSMSEHCLDFVVFEDTPGQTFTCTAVSQGGTRSLSSTVKRDTTPPVVTFGVPTPAPNAAGWNSTDVTVPFTVTDATSGVASSSAASPIVLDVGGVGVAGQVTVTDAAGNTATYETPARNIDKAAPVIEIGAPELLATYGFYADAEANYTCHDESPTSCTGTVASGAQIDTSSAGARIFRVTARDSVNRTASRTHVYFVEPRFHFSGFLGSAVAPPQLNLVPRGSMVPIRWQLPNRNGTFVSNPASFVSASVSSVSCGGAPTVPLDETATGPAGLSFDAATATFTYNWQTGANSSGCRKLTIKLKDDSTHELRFRFQ